MTGGKGISKFLILMDYFKNLILSNGVLIIEMIVVKGKAYVGQTGRSFSGRYKEHRLSYRTNNTNSNFAQHLLENSHAFAPIDKALHILEFQKESIHMNSLERFHIYKEALFVIPVK
jgi:hypothetical protein